MNLGELNQPLFAHKALEGLIKVNSLRCIEGHGQIYMYISFESSLESITSFAFHKHILRARESLQKSNLV